MRSLKERRLKSIFLGRYRTGREQWRAVTALIVAVLTLFGLGQGIVALYEGATSSDQINRLAAVLSGPPAGVLPVTLLEIDDATRQAWGGEATTPHGALAELIAIARERDPLAILVDITLAFDETARPANAALYGVIANHPASAAPLLLTRVVSFKRGADGKRVDSVYRVTPYDPALQGKDNVIWVSALPELGSDRVVRHLRLWQAHCEGLGAGASLKEVHPAPPLALMAGLDGCKRCADMKSFLAQRALHECRGEPWQALALWPPYQKADAAIPFTIDGDGEPIGATVIERDGKPTDLLRRFSARLLVKHEAGADGAPRIGDIDREPFAHRVVVIGGTHGDTGDVQMTPFGSMQGALIIANTLAAARAMIEAPEAGSFKHHALAFALFVLFAFIAARLESAPAAIAIGIAGTLALAIFSRVVGFGGALQAVATGLAAFGLFKLLDSIAGIAHQWRRGRGWRAMFKPPQTPAR